METFSIINKPIPLRTMRRGDQEIEIWDESSKIDLYIKTFLDKKEKTNKNIKILKYDQKNTPKFINRGQNTQNRNNITIKIATFNIGGLGREIKTESLEMFLYHNNIDLALIQETRKNKSLFLRKYKAISKKSYGKGRRKGGLSRIFKPFLNLFITEKLINHEDFMAVNLNEYSIINCYGRLREQKPKKLS
ncbi:ap endonuclease [Anaeramoeba flamelloides]|uniref:Ap endonuclease n=1 Tax=Anaeramoeba flamelloides TaxID=1746091 RepID=A0AAV7ZGY9_9EUKA|nr:ap endonuclease [Anaeramoeba flamelloides]